MYEYWNDPYGKICLERASESKSVMGFGAVLIDRHGTIVATDRNRRATPIERALLSHVDYAIHAEQGCIAQALRRGIALKGSEIFVLGIVLRGAARGKLSIREERFFTCRKCPHAFLAYDIAVWIPLTCGWSKLTPQEAFETARERGGNGYWKRFAEKL